MDGPHVLFYSSKCIFKDSILTHKHLLPLRDKMLKLILLNVTVFSFKNIILLLLEPIHVLPVAPSLKVFFYLRKTDFIPVPSEYYL